MELIKSRKLWMKIDDFYVIILLNEIKLLIHLVEGSIAYFPSVNHKYYLILNNLPHDHRIMEVQPKARQIYN